jgi:hypothetical protein
MTLLEAWWHEEGWYELGSRPRRNNNPGDLEWGKEAKAFGALRGDVVDPNGFGGYSGFAVFYTAKIGMQAHQRWLSVPAKFDAAGDLIGGYLGATVQKAVYRYAPPAQNDSAAYLAGLCQNADVTPSTVLTIALLQTPEV